MGLVGTAIAALRLLVGGLLIPGTADVLSNPTALDWRTYHRQFIVEFFGSRIQADEALFVGNLDIKNINIAGADIHMHSQAAPQSQGREIFFSQRGVERRRSGLIWPLPL